MNGYNVDADNIPICLIDADWRWPFQAVCVFFFKIQAVFKKQIDVFVEEGLDFVLCEVTFF